MLSRIQILGNTTCNKLNTLDGQRASNVRYLQTPVPVSFPRAYRVEYVKSRQ